MKKIALSLVALIAFASPALSQQRYHTNQSGLPGTQSSYVQEGSISPTAVRDASGGRVPTGILGLPAVRTSPYMNTPGDGIRSDLGNRINGTRAIMPASAAPVGIKGLPPVRNSAYMSTPGDGIRSDLGNRIDGGIAGQRRVIQPTVPRTPQTTVIMSYPEYRTPSDYGGK